MIAIIGDGVNLEYYPTVRELSFDLKVNKKKALVKRGSHIKCMSSGATNCAAIIKKYCSEALLGSIQVDVDDEFRCDPTDLVIALEWCVDADVNIVQIAVNGFDSPHIDMLRNVISKLHMQGCLVVTSMPDGVVICPHMCIDNLIIAKANKKWNDNSISGIELGVEVYAPAQHDILTNQQKITTTKLLNINAASVVVARLACNLSEYFNSDNQYENSVNSCKNLGIKFLPLGQRILLMNLELLHHDLSQIISIGGKCDIKSELAVKLSKYFCKNGERCRVFTDNTNYAGKEIEIIPDNLSVSLYTFFVINALRLNRAIILTDNKGIFKASDYNFIIDPKRKRNHYYNSTIYMPYNFDNVNIKNAVDYIIDKNKNIQF